MNKVTKDNINKEKGSYKDCMNCSLRIKCCSNFDKINAPVLSEDEVGIIMKHTDNNNFYNIKDDKIFQLKTIDNECFFYKNGRCNIYNYRPIDCRLYPYDIIKDDHKYYLIIYLINCINVEEFLKNNPLDDELIKIIIPWIEDFTNEINYTKMKNYKYKIIREIDI